MGQFKKVYILTNFQEYLKSYSPIIVVQSQIEMLLNAGYQPTLITNTGWNPPEASVFSNVKNAQLTSVIIDGNDVDEKFEADVNILKEQLLDILEDDCVVITHDLIFLPDYVKLNVACREIAQINPTIQWLHWIHSATNPQDLIKERAMFAGKYAEHLNDKFPNSLICFPNSYDIPRVARNFNYEEPDVVEVPHPTDLSEILSPRFRRLWWDKELYRCKYLMCYPLRLDRGKQPEMNVRLMAGFKHMGEDSHLVFCDFQSTGGDKVIYREELKNLAGELEVTDRVTFMSEYDPSAFMEVEHKEVMLFQALCNSFLFPSKSETYSLVTQEAMGLFNFCVLNHDFAPLRQIYGNNAIYRQFSANIGMDGQNGNIETTHEPLQNYFNDLAQHISFYTDHEKTQSGAVFVRTQRNPSYVFQKYMEPLLLKESEGDQIQGEIFTDVLGDSAKVMSRENRYEEDQTN